MQTYDVFPLLSPSKSYKDAFPQLLIYGVEWMNGVPLQNASIARVTLSIEIPTAKNMLGDTSYSRVIEDVRTRTFPGALSVSAGLLALMQSVHVILFGKRLLWGLLGAWPSRLTFHIVQSMGHHLQDQNFWIHSDSLAHTL